MNSMVTETFPSDPRRWCRLALLGLCLLSSPAWAREWKRSDDGQVIHGQLKGVRDGQLLLLLRDGKKAEVPITSLRDVDRDYLRQLFEKGILFRLDNPSKRLWEGEYQLDFGYEIRAKGGLVSFQIHNSWDRMNRVSGTRYRHSTPAELAAVRDGGGEWDTEYARICNEMFPFDRCVCHVGSEGFGKNGRSFGDLQVRLYLLDGDCDEIAEIVKKRGLPLAERMNSEAGALLRGDSQKCLVSDETNDWKRHLLSYDRVYGDYGARANVDVRARQYESRTAVFVFMTAAPRDHAATIDLMLDSLTVRSQ